MLDAMRNALDADPPRNIRGLKRLEYDLLARALGKVSCELLEGHIVEKPVIGAAHAGVTVRLAEAFHAPATRKGMTVRQGLPFAATDDSEPEPDLAVVTSEAARSIDAHPDRAFLIVEVCHTSDYNDRVVKTRIYAQAGVPEYWIVDVDDKTIEIYTKPRGRRYDEKRVTSEGTVAPGALPDARIDLAELFR